MCMYKNKVVTEEVRTKVLEGFIAKEYEGIAPTDDWDEEQPYEYEDYVLSKICVVEIDPEWLSTQDWWKNRFKLLPAPRYLARIAGTGNTGGDYLLDETGNLWNDTDDMEYGASGPAYNGCYCEGDRVAILEWVDELLADMTDTKTSIWL